MSSACRQDAAPGWPTGYNGTGSDIAAALVVMADATNTDGIQLPSATTDPILGVTRSIAYGAAADGPQRCVVQTSGRAICTSSAAITVGARVMADNAGKVLTWSAGAGTNANVVGIARTATTGTGQEVEVLLAGPGVISQG